MSGRWENRGKMGRRGSNGALERRKENGVDLMIFIKETTKKLPYSGKLSREKTFMNFTVLWLCMKVFSAKFVAMVFFTASNLRTLSLRKSYFSPIRESFIPRKFPAMRYYLGCGVD